MNLKIQESRKLQIREVRYVFCILNLLYQYYRFFFNFTTQRSWNSESWSMR